MKRRDPLDRAIDFTFGVPIAATAFMREATRIAVHAIASSRASSATTREPDVDDEQDAGAAASPADRTAAPFDGYDEMDARELLAVVETLDGPSLSLVEAYESENRGRRTVLVKVATMRQSTPS